MLCHASVFYKYLEIYLNQLIDYGYESYATEA